MYTKQIVRIFKDPYTLMLIGIILLGALVRLYHFEGFVGYLGDQGRDAIVIRRIVTLEHFPGIGPSSSVGNVFLGPFFYYFSAPWLLLSNFDPIGPAYGVVIVSIMSLPLMYVALKKLFDKNTALVVTFFMALSYSMVSLSRFAWNPNLLPITSFFTLYAFIRARDTQSKLMYFIVGVLFSVSMQLHYVALALGLPMGIYFMKDGYRAIKFKSIRKYLFHMFYVLVGFVLLTLPLIVFDLKNNFLNVRGFMGLFQGERSTGRPPIQEITYTFSQFFYHAFQFDISDVTAGLILVALIAGGIYAFIQKKHTLVVFHVFFLCVLLLTSFFTQVKNLHYLGPLYPIMYTLFAYYLVQLSRFIRMPLLILLVLTGFLFFQRQLTMYFQHNGSFLIRRAEHISRHILKNSSGTNIQLTSLPDHYGDYMYRYYLEVWGKRPVERASLIKADELFVVCEDACEPIGDPQWDIAYFEPTHVVGTWEVEDVTIYKLIRK